MILHKKIVLDIIKDVEKSILDSLEHPISKGRMRKPVPESIADYKQANIVEIATKILNEITDPYLDKKTYDKFLNDVICAFKRHEVSQVTVYYPPNCSSSCWQLLNNNVSRQWDEILQRELFYSIEQIKTELHRGIYADYPAKIAEILDNLKEYSAHFNDAQFNFQQQLIELKNAFQSYQEAQMEKGLTALDECLSMVTPKTKLRFM